MPKVLTALRTGNGKCSDLLLGVAGAVSNDAESLEYHRHILAKQFLEEREFVGRLESVAGSMTMIIAAVNEEMSSYSVE